MVRCTLMWRRPDRRPSSSPRRRLRPASTRPVPEPSRSGAPCSGPNTGDFDRGRCARGPATPAPGTATSPSRCGISPRAGSGDRPRPAEPRRPGSALAGREPAGDARRAGRRAGRGGGRQAAAVVAAVEEHARGRGRTGPSSAGASSAANCLATRRTSPATPPTSPASSLLRSSRCSPRIPARPSRLAPGTAA